MKTALITGASQRIGEIISTTLHKHNYNVIIHYRHSKARAIALNDKLNAIRADSSRILQAELTNINELEKMAKNIKNLDLLVNNASVFYPTDLNTNAENAWHELINTNLRAPFFLSQFLSPVLGKNQGCIINIVDIHSQRPLKNHAIYNISKAGLAMLTKTLGKELAPDIRVCGVSPGSILWPQNANFTPAEKNKILAQIPLKKQGCPQDIADAVLFLSQSTYITGQIINIDGGRTLNQ